MRSDLIPDPTLTPGASVINKGQLEKRNVPHYNTIHNTALQYTTNTHTTVQLSYTPVTLPLQPTLTKEVRPRQSTPTIQATTTTTGSYSIITSN